MAEVPDSCLRSGMQPVLDTLVKDVARDLVSVSLLDARTKTKTKLTSSPTFLASCELAKIPFAHETCPSFCRVSRSPANPHDFPVSCKCRSPKAILSITCGSYVDDSNVDAPSLRTRGR